MKSAFYRECDLHHEKINMHELASLFTKADVKVATMEKAVVDGENNYEMQPEASISAVKNSEIHSSSDIAMSFENVAPILKKRDSENNKMRTKKI